MTARMLFGPGYAVRGVRLAADRSVSVRESAVRLGGFEFLSVDRPENRLWVSRDMEVPDERKEQAR